MSTKYFAKGKRGIIYVKKNIVIKVKNPKSKAINRIRNEAKYLKILNKYNIGPRFISFNGKLKYKFVKGKYIVDYIKENNKKNIIKMLKNVLQQCFVMDKLKINKLEMNRPLKHILVDKKPVLIDFERCYKTEKPKNVTQFVQFLISENIKKILKIKINKNKMIKLAKKYKKNMNKKNFDEIIKEIK